MGGEYVILALLLLSAPPAAELELESPQRAFTTTYELVLDDGFIRRRRRGGAWTTLAPPAPRDARIERIKELLPAQLPLIREFDKPRRLVELDADGENIIVVDERRRVYYAKLNTLAWTDSWGPPALAGPLTLPDDVVDWAISHRALPYEDIDGNPHPISAGVTTLYALTRDSRILYADPWLPPKFERDICPPERGALTLVTLAASASTLAVMDDGGTVWTRLADFDTTGNNPALLYTWQRGRRTGVNEENVRTLPPEDWRKQPPIPGPHTTSLTIFQTTAVAAGDGANGARVLRVEGDGGYWQKALFDDAWRFVKSTRFPPSGAPRVERKEATRRAAWGESLRGKVGKADVVVEGFDVRCPGARARVTRDDETVELMLWHAERLLELSKLERDLPGAVVVVGNPQGALAKELLAQFNGGTFIEVEVDVTRRAVHVQTPTWTLKLKRER